MKSRVRWLKQLAILVMVIAATGLAFILVLRAFPAPHRGNRERAAGGKSGERREFHGPQVARGAPLVLKQIAIVGMVALLGRKVLRIRL